MDFSLGGKAKIYIDKNGYISATETNRSIEVDIIVFDKYSPPHEIFITAKALDDTNNDETIVINKKCKKTWEEPVYSPVSNIDDYIGQRGKWLYSHMLYASDNQSVAVGKRRNEKPCQVCERPNDIGVCTCWWCGNKPH